MPVTTEVWGTNSNGPQVQLFHLTNDHLKVQLTDLGASLVAVETRDAKDRWDNVMITATAEQCLTGNSPLGVTVGRFANRIGLGKFELNGKKFTLATNNGPNHLHGGKDNFSKRIWALTDQESDTLTFSLVSPDGDQGYPGEVNVSITYALEENRLILNYKATTSAATIINLTNHGYWNLTGDNTASVYDHQLQLFADQYLENDEHVLPTGHILSVENSPYDFREPTRLGEHIKATRNGYDNCFCINDWDQTLREAAIISDPISGRIMKVLTTEPGIQLYTANHFDGTKTFGGAGKHHAFCLECQHYPDAPNLPAFPSTELNPGATYLQTTIHEFTTI